MSKIAGKVALLLIGLAAALTAYQAAVFLFTDKSHRETVRALGSPHALTDARLWLIGSLVIMIICCYGITRSPRGVKE